MAEEEFIRVGKEAKLDQWEIKYATENPEGLTKEGIQYNYDSWKNHSKNQYVIKKYEVMLKICKDVKSSGKLEDGRTILARKRDGGIWAEKID